MGLVFLICCSEVLLIKSFSRGHRLWLSLSISATKIAEYPRSVGPGTHQQLFRAQAKHFVCVKAYLGCAASVDHLRQGRHRRFHCVRLSHLVEIARDLAAGRLSATDEPGIIAREGINIGPVQHEPHPQRGVCRRSSPLTRPPAELRRPYVRSTTP